MDASTTRFIIERMDSDFREMRIYHDKKFEALAQKIDDLQSFKNRVVGMAMMAGAVGSLVVNLVVKIVHS